MGVHAPNKCTTGGTGEWGQRGRERLYSFTFIFCLLFLGSLPTATLATEPVATPTPAPPPPPYVAPPPPYVAPPPPPTTTTIPTTITATTITLTTITTTTITSTTKTSTTITRTSTSQTTTTTSKTSTTRTTTTRTTTTRTTTTTTTYEPGSFECTWLGNRAVIAVPQQFRKYDDPDHPVTELNKQLQRCHGSVSPLGANLMSTRAFPSSTADVHVVQGANQEQLTALLSATSRSQFNTNLIQVIRPGGYISAASEGDCELIATSLTAVAYEKHHSRLVEDACKFSTTTTTITSTTVTTTTKTTMTTTTAVHFQFACAGKNSFDDKEQLLVVPEGLACETKLGVGMVDQLESLVHTCTGSSQRPNFGCGTTSARYAGGGHAVLGFTTRMLAVIAARVADSLMVPTPPDITTCFCAGEEVNGDGAADCSSTDNGVPYCMTARGACSDGKRLAFFRDDLDYSQRACSYWMETDTLQFKAPPATCSAVAALLNAALEDHRSGRMHQCTPVSTSPTSTATTTPTTTLTTTTQTTTPTTSPTTSTTPTTTPTTTQACKVGEFLDNGSRCALCPSGQWQDQISQPKCKPCTPLPSSTMYETEACTPATDNVHVQCTVCDATLEYEHTPCTDRTNTVCAAITDCTARCKYHPDVDVCFASASSKIACDLLTPTRDGNSGQVSCQAPDFDPSAADRCKYQPELNRCIQKWNAPVSGGSGCPSFPEDACRQSQATAGGKCVWDDALYSCRDKACKDVHVPSKCLSSSLGCAYNDIASYCHKKGGETPCSAFTSQSSCSGASQNSDRCMFSKATGLCRVNVAVAGKLPCHFYNGEDINKCPNDRCTLDPHATVCREQHETTPCEKYSKVNCPHGGANSVPEFARTQATVDTDVQCQFVGADCDTTSTSEQDDGGSQHEYTKQATTATSDIICETVTTCNLETEFEEVAPTPTSDRSCATATPACLAAKQFEAAPLTPTSDRQCTVLSNCDHLGGDDATEYIATAATSTSNRACALLTVCSPTERQEYVATAATATSNRVCAPFTPCAVENKIKYQSSPPASTHDRTCKALTVCAAGEKYEVTPPLGGSAYGIQVLVTDRVCKTITQCMIPDEYESIPATATSDARCAAATAPCNGAGVKDAEYEVVPLTPTSNRECQAITECNMTAYTLVSPTPTSDRMCNSVYCPPNYYRTGVDQETKLLVCVELSKPCNPDVNEYEEVAPTHTTDRKCATFQCSTGMYLPAGAALHPKNCKTWVDCKIGAEFEAFAPSATTDRVCNPISPYCDTANVDSFEKSAPTSTSDRICSECLGCGDGFKTATACSSTADTICSECSHCPTGEYAVANCTDVKPALCSTCNRCLPGYFHVESCSPYTNAECSRCSRCIDKTEYQSVACSADADTACDAVAPQCNWPTEYEAAAPTATSQRVCKNVTTVCLDNEWEVAEPTQDSNRNCTSHSICNVEWCPRSSWKLLAKADINDDDEGDSGFTFVPNRWIQSNTLCQQPANADECIDFGYDPEFEVIKPTASTDRRCRCPTEGVCQPGSYEVRPPSTIDDRVCHRCPGGTFQNMPGQLSCKPVRECSTDGYEWQSSAPTTSSDRVCRAVSNCPKQYETFQVKESTAVSDRVCQNVTLCDEKTQWESAASTETSDRFCGTIGVCKRLQFQVNPPSEKSNRECAKLADCNKKQWECKAPAVAAVINNKGVEVQMKIANRECCAHSPCSEEQFVQAKATSTADTLCEDYRVCNGTEYESRAGSVNKNRRCSPITECAKHKEGTLERYEIKPATATEDAVCAIATVCPAGAHERSAPRSGADRTCRDCNGITQWQDTSGQPDCKDVAECDPKIEFMAQSPTKTANGVCIALTVCSDDDYASTQHTAVTDRKCSQCRTCDPKKQLTVALPCTQDANTVCRLATICGSNEFEAAPLTASNDRACQAHRVCGSDEYADRLGTPTRDAFCTELTACSPGSFVAEQATLTSDRVCKACIKEVSYSATENAPLCTNCTAGCPPGTFTAVHCTRLANAVCEACPYGSFSNAGADCTPWMNACPAGTAEILTPNTYHDRGCVLCSYGTFRSASSALSGSKSCVPLTKCAPGYQPAHAANVTTDTVCEPIPTTTSTITTSTATTATETTATATTTTGTLFQLAERSKAASTGTMTSALYIAAAVVGIMVLALLYLCCDCRGLWDGSPAAHARRSYKDESEANVRTLQLRQARDDAHAFQMEQREKQDRLTLQNPNAIKRGRRPSIHRHDHVVNFEGTEVSEL